MSDPNSVVFKLCIEPTPLQTELARAAQLDIHQKGYDKCKDLETLEERKTAEGKAYRHYKVEPADPLVRLASFNLKSKLAKEYAQELKSLRLGDGSGSTLECKVVLAGDATTMLTRKEESHLAQAAIVAPATRWLCGKREYSWIQTGDVMQSTETPGVGDLWLCVGWVWQSSNRSFFHYQWSRKGKLPPAHCILIRMLSVVSYIAEFQAGIVTDPVDLDSFDVASLHFDDVDTCLWMKWWHEFFPQFPHSRYTRLSITLIPPLTLLQSVRLCEFANGCYDWLCAKKGVGLWTLRQPALKPLVPGAVMGYKYPPAPSLFLTPTGQLPEEEEDEVQEVQPPPPPPAPPLKKRTLSAADLPTAETKEKKRKKTGGASSPFAGSSLAGSERGSESQVPSAMGMLQEIRSLLKKDDSLAEKRHALCHTNLMAAIAKQFQNLEKVQVEGLTALQNDLLKALAEAVASAQGGTGNVADSFSASATSSMLATVTSVVVETMKAAQEAFHDKLNYNSAVMLDDIRSQTEDVHSAVVVAQESLSTTLSDQVDNVTSDLNTLREEVQSLRELVTAAVATRAPITPVPSFRRHPSVDRTTTTGIPQGQHHTGTTSTSTAALFAGGPQPAALSTGPTSSASGAQVGGAFTRGGKAGSTAKERSKK